MFYLNLGFDSSVIPFSLPVKTSCWSLTSSLCKQTVNWKETRASSSNSFRFFILFFMKEEDDVTKKQHEKKNPSPPPFTSSRDDEDGDEDVG